MIFIDFILGYDKFLFEAQTIEILVNLRVNSQAKEPQESISLGPT